MKLLQFRENEFVNLDAIASVRVIQNEQKRTYDSGHQLMKTEKIGETLTLHVTLFNGTQIHFVEPFAHDAYDVLFGTSLDLEPPTKTDL